MKYELCPKCNKKGLHPPYGTLSMMVTFRSTDVMECKYCKTIIYDYLKNKIKQV